MRTFTIGNAFGSGVFAVLLLIAILSILAAPPTPEQVKGRNAFSAQMHQKQKENAALCGLAAACRKYDKVRLECATAANFKTCLRTKMGDDASYIPACIGAGEEGAPAMPIPTAPNHAQCLLIEALP
jgi:hypothetical protein